MQNDSSTAILKINDFTGDPIFQNQREIQELEEWCLSSWKCREMTRSSKNWRLPSNLFFHKKKVVVSIFQYPILSTKKKERKFKTAQVPVTFLQFPKDER